ncbi:MAG TPA: hypothetical protein VFS77_08970, partial [Pyrinomonadaceae bacterium]|nr:hypothetical protein [Pyrinomonadaceae bacterium]
LSRMTSETRTFAGLSGSYALNYSYNLANALTGLSIPFRSRQVGYSYDTAGRLSGVTATGFSATHYAWPNQYTQNLSSFASNIAYRASGVRKSMTYGNTTSEQTTYNARLQPTSHTLNNMNYQNTNVCCSYPTYSTMTWNFGYYNDGSLEHAWDSTNEWFDRAYKYDHVGRLKEASTFRRAHGLSPYPTINYPDPYFQTITYDAFNHSNRTGKLYTGEPSDIGPYVNNRRAGWVYDADGNTTSDSSYLQTIDASGTNIRSVSHAKVGDGIQYPLQPRLDITQTYDGDGQPAKRVQISRLPGLIDEFGNPGEPLENTQTTYYVRSNLLGGATVAELGDGNTIHIYAAGQRIARDVWDNVTFEHHNPANGSWVTSHGHSSYRTTNREERDPLGAETPLSNPYAQSYVDWKFAEPLFIEGGDPFDYSGGLMLDGMPVSASEFARRANAGGLAIAFSGAVSGTVPVVPAGFGLFVYERPAGWHADNEEGPPRLDWEEDSFSAFGQAPARDRKMNKDQIKSYMDEISQFLANNPDCEVGINTILSELKNITGFDGGNIRDIIANFTQNGILRVSDVNNASSSAGVGYGGIPAISLSERDIRSDTIVTMVGEMIHWAGMVGHLGPEYPNDFALPDYSGFTKYFTDLAIATAVNNLGYAMTVDQYRRTYPEVVRRDTERWGSDFAASKIAHGGINNACFKAKNRLLPKFAKQ